ncbi:hypothetical protein SODALDRAFT_354102 [Sodiomyces alkalinus F11]|uniref:Uncharacterized protein n=1 Tax=Sodiomyces alkalinus (strain CBS 110278 / VKM F-3762 / F11) TaxID=1314773 RepID=A0A3N2Q5T3_SODAK|nr:hypothetical protein SODALDRAFT_354102 [Sodiomyces alkalinus F11]ROT41985.1 hypothetical protein SODALDRAFT_354102 [Sodiomyces alkalinus F11]
MPAFSSPVDGPSTTAPPIQRLTLVFIHGWPMSSRMYDHFYSDLVDKHRYRIVATDPARFRPKRLGWTNGPTTKDHVTWATFTADLTSLLEHLDVDPFVFVAASILTIHSSVDHPFWWSPMLRVAADGFDATKRARAKLRVDIPFCRTMSEVLEHYVDSDISVLALITTFPKFPTGGE